MAKPLRSIGRLFSRKTLLLLGGVFSIAAIAGYLAMTSSLAVDLDGLLPGDAVGAVTLHDDVANVADLLPKEAADLYKASAGKFRQVSEAAFFMEPHPNGNGLKWGVVIYGSASDRQGPRAMIATESASATEAFVFKPHWRLVPKGSIGVGFIDQGGKVPIELKLNENKLIVRVGRDERGFFGKTPAWLLPQRSIRSIPNGSAAYLYDASPAKDKIPANLPFSQIFRTFTGSSELLLGASSDASRKAFVFVAQQALNSLETSKLDGSIKDALGKADPEEDKIQLPDKTISLEKRSSANEVKVETRELKSGTLKTFTTPKHALTMTYFMDKDGQVWLSDSIKSIQASIMSLPNEGRPFSDECVPLESEESAIIYPQNVKGLIEDENLPVNILSRFNAISFALNNRETGLFTVCGYL